jgi:hypothetical protein
MNAAFKLGRRPRAHNPRVPHLSALLMPALPQPPPPSAVDWTKGLPDDLGMMLNDELGDCTCAAFYHAKQIWTFNTGRPMDTEPDAIVKQLYEEACGYNPAQGGEGPGGVEQDVLAYLARTGAPLETGGRDQLAAFVEVDIRNLDDIRRTINDCGVCYIGFQVPDYLMESGPSAIWDVAQGDDGGIVGGHAVILAGYTTSVIKVISWGRTYYMTWAFFQKYVDEAYALADASWVSSKGTTPGGLSLVALESQMEAIKEQMPD